MHKLCPSGKYVRALLEALFDVDLKRSSPHTVTRRLRPGDGNRSNVYAARPKTRGPLSSGRRRFQEKAPSYYISWTFTGFVLLERMTSVLDQRSEMVKQPAVSVSTARIVQLNINIPSSLLFLTAEMSSFCVTGNAHG
jgi:hypothetical protein